MASKLEELLARSISALEKRNKPLPQRPSPKRPQRLTNYFLPSSPTLPPGSRSWSPPPPSPKAPPSLSGFTLSPTPPTPLTQRRYLEQEPPLASKAVEERMALLELENTNLRKQNKVLYKQNSDFRELIQEYKACNEKANDCMGRIEAARDAIGRITQDVTVEVKTYEMAKASVRRAERVATREWKKFVNENASMGIEVEEVVRDIITENAMEITVAYPYQDGGNMI